MSTQAAIIPDINYGAVVSPCGQYRYKLWREWDETTPPAVFIMLNPSTADDFTDDPTITRCMKRAMQYLPVQCGGLVVVNLFGYRETDSTLLPALHKGGVDLVGQDNDAWILDAVKNAAIIICAWGGQGGIRRRATDVLNMMRERGCVLHALKLDKDGNPGHPLYVPYNAVPFVYSGLSK